MYKITRIKEISRVLTQDLVERINYYIDEEIQEDECLIDIKYFNITQCASNLNFEEPNVVHLIIGKLI